MRPRPTEASQNVTPLCASAIRLRAGVDVGVRDPLFGLAARLHSAAQRPACGPVKRMPPPVMLQDRFSQVKVAVPISRDMASVGGWGHMLKAVKT